jgi:hypothetical protein
LWALLRTIRPSWKYLAPTALVALLSFGLLCFSVGQRSPSLGDALAFLSLGMPPFDVLESAQVFRIPLLWLALYAWLLFSALALVRPRPSCLAYRTFFSLRHRGSYWLVAYLATMAHIVVHFAAVLLTTLLCVLLAQGEPTFQLTAEFAGRFLGDAAPGLSGGVVLAHALLLPLIACCAIAALEVCMMHYAGQALSYLCAIALLVVSAAFASLLLPGNYLMLLRHELFSPGGLSAALGAFVLLVYLLAAYVAGHLKARKWDYL